MVGYADAGLGFIISMLSALTSVSTISDYSHAQSIAHKALLIAVQGVLIGR